MPHASRAQAYVLVPLCGHGVPTGHRCIAVRSQAVRANMGGSYTGLPQSLLRANPVDRLAACSRVCCEGLGVAIAGRFLQIAGVAQLLGRKLKAGHGHTSTTVISACPRAIAVPAIAPAKFKFDSNNPPADFESCQLWQQYGHDANRLPASIVQGPYACLPGQLCRAPWPGLVVPKRACRGSFVNTRARLLQVTVRGMTRT